MFVKICGTTNLVDAELAVQLGAAAVGFIFAPSKRRVTVEQAASVVGFLPHSVERVGVFTVANADEIARTVRAVGLSAVQMHWAYDAGRIAALREALGAGVKLWQVVGVEVNPANREDAERVFIRLLRAAMLDARLAVVLLDTVKDGASGGLGETFSWWRVQSTLKLARMAAAHAEEERREPLPGVMLAGGLKAENLRDAIAAIRPSGVDVVSGVEARPGIKSEDRMRAFMNAAREAEASFPPLR